MAKTTAPLLSFGASGSLAKTMVASKWKGRPYMRQHVVPANPKSAEQTLTRGAFAFGSSIWKFADTIFRESWERFAVGQVLTGRNAMMGSFVKEVRGETTLAKMIFSPGAKGGPPATNVTATAGVAEITVSVTAPTPPPGWTLVEAQSTIILDQDPNAPTDSRTQSASVPAPGPYDMTYTGLATQLYRAGGWLKWAKPDGSYAYGVSATVGATPT